MTPDTVVHLMRQALAAAFWVSLPLLALGFIVGIVVSLAQIVTSIQDSAVGTIPRLAAFAIGLVLTMPWMLRQTMTYTSALLADLGRYAR